MGNNIKHPMDVNVNTRIRWEAMQAFGIISSPQGKNVLDLAAGLGFFSVQLSKRGAKVLATDIHAASLKYLAENHNIETKVFDLQAEEYPEGKFDLILLCEVLEHVQSPHKIVFKISKMLSPGGVLIVTTPALEGLLTKTPGKSLGHHHGAEKHERDGFTQKELTIMLAESGLTVQKKSYCIYFAAELFMQFTKLVYILKKKKYHGQEDVVATMSSMSYKILSYIYPILHKFFVFEQYVCTKLKLHGHCHVIAAEKKQ